jgi:hypothetical protein
MTARIISFAASAAAFTLLAYAILDQAARIVAA